MVVGGSSEAKDVVITVEPTRADSTSPWSEETRAAARNCGSGFRGWLAEEAAWMLAQFARVAVSVFVARGVTKLFQVGAASQEAYTRAERLWGDGYRESSHPISSRDGWGPAGNGGGESTYDPSGTADGNGFDSRTAAPRNPRYVGTASGYHLYAHDTVLDPARQWWPCPILLRSACESCHFFEYDRGGNPHCAAVLKMRTVLDGLDAGEEFDELRQWIRAHEPSQSRNDSFRRYAEELKRTRGLSFLVRMGLNSGEVVVGRIGDDLRMDYTAQGQTVGLAARMEQLAAPVGRRDLRNDAALSLQRHEGARFAGDTVGSPPRQRRIARVIRGNTDCSISLGRKLAKRRRHRHRRTTTRG
jgi:hypothetical protein